jgi:hypothetical protein
MLLNTILQSAAPHLVYYLSGFSGAAWPPQAPCLGLCRGPDPAAYQTGSGAKDKGQHGYHSKKATL